VEEEIKAVKEKIQKETTSRASSDGGRLEKLNHLAELRAKNN
jgi:hypothetical protein